MNSPFVFIIDNSSMSASPVDINPAVLIGFAVMSEIDGVNGLDLEILLVSLFNP